MNDLSNLVGVGKVAVLGVGYLAPLLVPQTGRREIKGRSTRSADCYGYSRFNSVKKNARKQWRFRDTLRCPNSRCRKFT